MQLNNKMVAAIAVVVVGIIAGFYTMTSTDETKEANPNMPESNQQVDEDLPPGHPTVMRGDGSTDTVGGVPSAEQPINQARAGKAVEPQDAKFTHFRVGDRNVKALYVDGSVLWAGTSGGVVRYDTATDDYRLYDYTNGLLSNGVFSIGRLEGRIALGTYGGGMSLFDESKNKWENFNVPNGLGDAFVYKTLEASNGDIWIATWSGVNRIRGGNLRDRSKWDIYTVENTNGGLINDWVYSLAEGKDGVIWLATEGGLVRYKDGKWKNWNHDKGVGASYETIKNDPRFGVDPASMSEHHARQAKEMGLEGVSGGGAYNPNYIVALTIGKNGDVWCGTWGGGLARFDGKKWRNYTMADGLPGNLIFSLFQDPDGDLWVGTNKGLARYDGKEFTVMTVEDGLFSNTIFSIAEGPDGSRWIGHFGGVTHLLAE